jgi:SAM-dependent methyltransferase
MVRPRGQADGDRRRVPHVPADVRNARFDPGGAIDPVDYAFPFDDGSFHVAVVMSVLTHLTADPAVNCADQTRRVLAAGGRMLATFLVLDPDAPALGPAFGPVAEGMAAVGPDRPEEAVAHAPEWVLEALRAAGLDLVELHPATWTGRPDGLSFQDVVLARA